MKWCDNGPWRPASRPSGSARETSLVAAQRQEGSIHVINGMHANENSELDEHVTTYSMEQENVDMAFVAISAVRLPHRASNMRHVLAAASGMTKRDQSSRPQPFRIVL
jgi:hypothetical protein